MHRMSIALWGTELALITLALLATPTDAVALGPETWLQTAPSVTTSGSTYGVGIGDFTGDGLVDLVVSVPANDQIAIITNAGPGVFTLGATYATLDNPQAVAVGDFNKDGRLDVACATTGSPGSLCVFTNTGASFTRVEYGGGAISCPTMRATDLNGDGALDLALADQTAGTLLVFLNDGAGLFGIPVSYPAGGTMYDLSAGDIDGDGDIDVAVAAGGMAGVFINNGAGVLLGPASYGGTGITGVALADLDLDLDLDLAASGAFLGGDGDSVSVFLNAGGGALSAPVNFLVGGGGPRLVAGEFTGDGKIDLAVSPYLSILVNQGGAAFAEIPGSGSKDPPIDVAVADLDGDGDLDIAATGAVGASGGVSILHNNGNGSFAARLDSPLPVPYREPGHVIAADFNGDGRVDCAYLHELAFAAGGFAVMLNLGARRFSAPVSYSTGSYPQSFTASDLDGDGDLDLAVVNNVSSANGTMSVLRNAGNGTFGPPVDYAVGQVPVDVVAIDVDGDGDRDLAVPSGTLGTQTLHVWINQGTGTYGPRKAFVLGAIPYGAVAGDFDHNGFADLAIARDDFAIAVFYNTGLTFTVPIILATAGTPQTIEAGDVDGDGDLDLAILKSIIGGGQMSIFRNNGSGGFPTRTDYALPAWSGWGGDVALKDMDGDGDLDALAAVEPNAILSVFANDGAGNFGTRADYATAHSPRGVDTGDFDDNGRSDALVGNGSSASISVFYNSTAPTVAPAPRIVQSRRFQLLPRPVDSAVAVVHVEGATRGRIVVELYDLAGRCLDRRESLHEGIGASEISVTLVGREAARTSGVYFLRVHHGGQSWSTRVAYLR